ncbi:type II toxin-antitoxin system RelE/ParE family toxin [Xenorhabdus bovienii]|uniref:Type II toxin-antitoxin system RelE/ParE family toxin n=2 Tax=Xenorhabdus TaxID=626 RepID=A0AAJ1JB92_XENBV|nr:MULTISPECIES: type II toxin-antitoxin system RelE/ParE family toxin [Xenorhabdus]MDC9621330.1 type II toxin-antitoxin system RelE/ParE family toxin [Xenorhabdus aichiensis]MDE1480525.1 type II toxin-antitoxin system RelE/ParE family toxin [Xenorhabdus bovienii]MDE1486316.1 type II toxin-antitoxin system RelE/ParE family toxin [Xenorhabdus bovienii]MDE1492964.1 type II toxin-antitoxin system RelE/ParE family toxin [Xenorhabdus bovienii]MDE1496015.1 type II toxin-antitoxin system RelE/ParE fa
MIKSFKHKGLRLFFETGKTSGINSQHAKKLKQRLAVINDAEVIGDINLPGYRLHPLTGDREGQWSVTVSGNLRVTFEFIDGDAYIVNYEDYH